VRNFKLQTFTLLMIVALSGGYAITDENMAVYISPFIGDHVLTSGPKLDYVYLDSAFKLKGAQIQVKPFTMLAPRPADEDDEYTSDDVRWEHAGGTVARLLRGQSNRNLSKYRIKLTSGDAPYEMEGRIIEFRHITSDGLAFKHGALGLEFKVVEKETGKVVLAAMHRTTTYMRGDKLHARMVEFAKDDFPAFIKKLARKGKKESSLPTDPSHESYQVKMPESESGFANVVFYRFRWEAAMSTVAVNIDGIHVADLSAETYVIVKLKPGRHRFFSDKKNDAVTHMIEEGNTYYFTFEYPTGLFTHGRLILLPNELGELEFNNRVRVELKYATDILEPSMVVPR